MRGQKRTSPCNGQSREHGHAPRQTSVLRKACPPARRPRRAPRQISARREHTSCFLWLLYAPVGGGPPARSPHASLTARNDRSRGPPWPCRHPPAPQPPSQRASLGTPPPDLRAARGLPVLSPSTPRASLGASPRSPARPCRPRTTLQSGRRPPAPLPQPRRPRVPSSSGSPACSCNTWQPRVTRLTRSASSQVLSGTKLSPLAPSAVGTGQNSPCSS